MATTRSANGNLIHDALQLFEKVESVAVYILKFKKNQKLVQIDALDCALNDMLANLHNFGILFFYGIFIIP